MNTRPDPDLDDDLALVLAYDSIDRYGLSIAVFDVATEDVDTVRGACETAEWTGYSVTAGRDDRVVVTTVFDPRGCPIEDVAEALALITREAVTVADEREAPEPCGDCFRAVEWDEERKVYRHLTEPERGCFLIPDVVRHSYRIVPDLRTEKVRAVCTCGWRSDPVSNGGLAGAAADTHRASVVR